MTANIFRLLASNRIRKANLLLRNRLHLKAIRKLRNLNYFLFKHLVDTFSKRPILFRPITLLSIGTVMTSQEADLLKKVDELYDQNKFDEIESLLNKDELIEKSDKKWEYKWRLARSRYGQVKEKQRNESELDAIRDLVLSSLEDNSECGPAHKVRMCALN